MSSANLSGVDLQGLLRTAQGQEEALQSAKRQLEATVGQAESLAAGWTGAAAHSFQQALQNFLENGEAVCNALQDMHNTMMNTHNVFSNAHESTSDKAASAIKLTGAPIGLSGL